jgi:hypothetical protein
VHARHLVQLLLLPAAAAREDVQFFSLADDNSIDAEPRQHLNIPTLTTNHRGKMRYSPVVAFQEWTQPWSLPATTSAVLVRRRSTVVTQYLRTQRSQQDATKCPPLGSVMTHSMSPLCPWSTTAPGGSVVSCDGLSAVGTAVGSRTGDEALAPAPHTVWRGKATGARGAGSWWMSLTSAGGSHGPLPVSGNAAVGDPPNTRKIAREFI